MAVAVTSIVAKGWAKGGQTLARLGSGLRKRLGALWRGIPYREALASVLFMASLSVVLEHFGLFEWLDDMALAQTAHSEYGELSYASGEIDTVVLTITEDFYTTEFGAHTPINRDRFTSLLRDVLGQFANVPVIAVDYDLTPSAEPHCETAHEGVCAIADIERSQQKNLDKFLMEEAPGLLEANRQRLILLSPVRSALDESAVGWMHRIRGKGERVMFADPLLARDERYSSVLRYCRADHPERRQLVATRARLLPLGQQVNYAYGLAKGAQSEAHERTEGKERNSLSMINFGRQSTYVCPLIDSTDSAASCKRMLQDLHPHGDVRALFVGASYGAEDLFKTPLGLLYGVNVHALAAQSELHPVSRLSLLRGFLLDLAFGVVSAAIFVTLWSRVARAEENSFRRTLLIACVIGVLVGLAWLASHSVELLMKQGFWLNPYLVLVGVFVDSASNAVERVHEPTNHSHVHKKIVGWDRGLMLARRAVFFGVVLVAGGFLVESIYETESNNDCGAFYSVET